MTGRKIDFGNALTFWISSMNYYAERELTGAGGQDWYLLYRDKWITGALCKPITTDELLARVKSYSQGAGGFEFKYSTIAQMLMRDEWNDNVMLLKLKLNLEYLIGKLQHKNFGNKK